jgi:hypothetical protein
MLPGVTAKLDRAETLTHELQKLVKEWCAAQPPSLVKSIEDGWYVWRADPGAEPPPEFAVRAGEIANHARSCLDHTVYAVATAKGGPAGKSRHQYPITLSPSEFRRSSGSMLSGVPADAVKLIEQRQPYQNGGPQGDLLLMIMSMTNVDKHRTLLAARTTALGGTIRLTRSKPADVETEHFYEPHRTIEQPILMRARPLTPTANPVIDLSVDVTVSIGGGAWESDITFGADHEAAWARPYARELLITLRYLRDELLPELDPFL